MTYEECMAQLNILFPNEFAKQPYVSANIIHLNDKHNVHIYPLSKPNGYIGFLSQAHKPYVTKRFKSYTDLINAAVEMALKSKKQNDLPRMCSTTKLVIRNHS